MTKAKGIPRREGLAGREGQEILAHEPPSIRPRERDGFPLLVGVCLKSEAPYVESPSVSAFRGQDVLNTRPPPTFNPLDEGGRGSRTRRVPL